MDSWSVLRISDHERGTATEVDTCRTLVSAKYYVPIAWPALFAAIEFRDVPAHQCWFFTRISDVLPRLHHLTSQAAADPMLSAVFEGALPVAEWLDSLGRQKILVLDVHDYVGMDPPNVFRRNMIDAAAGFAALPASGVSAALRALLPDWLREHDPIGASAAARRWTRCNNPRSAYFNLIFGWPADETELAERWQPWFDAGLAAPPLPNSAEVAKLLQHELERHGVAAFSQEASQQPWIQRFLSIALRQRTVEVLAEVLTVMRARGLVIELHLETVALAQALRTLENSNPAACDVNSIHPF